MAYCAPRYCTAVCLPFSRDASEVELAQCCKVFSSDACSYSICMAHKHCCYHSGVPRREDFFVSSAVTLNASRPRSGPAYPVARLPCDFLMFFCVGDNSKY